MTSRSARPAVGSGRPDRPALGRTGRRVASGNVSKISLVAERSAVEDKQSGFEAALRDLIEAADDEAGLEEHAAHRSDDEPGVHSFFELSRDQQARDARARGERMRAAMGALGGLLAGRPEVVQLTPIAAKGLDL